MTLSFTLDQPLVLKLCTSCKEKKALDQFFKDSSRKDGLTKSCKTCEVLRSKKYFSTIPNLQKKKYRLKFSFNLSLEDYLLMLIVQEWRCAVCKIRFDDTFSINSYSAGPYVDHDHLCCPGEKSCGKCIRGLLCMKCNMAAGYLRDDPIVIDRLKKYLMVNVRCI